MKGVEKKQSPKPLTLKEKQRRYIRNKYKTQTELKNAPHFSQKGFGLFGGFVIFIGLILGIFLRGTLGFIVTMCFIGWVLWFIPNAANSWDKIEKY